MPHHLRACLLTIASGVVSFGATPVWADESSRPAVTISGTATVATDYRFRGITQTDGGEAVQGGVTVSHRSGLYFSAWGSSIDDYVAAGSDAEIDLIGGYAADLNGIEVDTGVLFYLYPGAARQVQADFYEPFASAKYKLGLVSLKAGVAYAPKQHAIASAHERDDNLYLYGEASRTFGRSGFSMTAHVGHTKGRSLLTDDEPGYWDWSATASYTFDRLTAGLSYVDTDVTRTGFETPSGKHSGRAGLVGSVGVAF